MVLLFETTAGREVLRETDVDGSKALQTPSHLLMQDVLILKRMEMTMVLMILFSASEGWEEVMCMW